MYLGQQMSCGILTNRKLCIDSINKILKMLNQESPKFQQEEHVYIFS